MSLAALLVVTVLVGLSVYGNYRRFKREQVAKKTPLRYTPCTLALVDNNRLVWMLSDVGLMAELPLKPISDSHPSEGTERHYGSARLS